MVSEADKFYGVLLLFFSPVLLLGPAYVSAYATNLCVGFRPELYLPWFIVALPVLASYTRLSFYMTEIVYILVMVASGALYAYLFYSLTVPHVKCEWFLGDLARTVEAFWASIVGLFYVLHGVFKIPPTGFALLAVSEFHIFYLFYTGGQLLNYILQYVSHLQQHLSHLF